LSLSELVAAYSVEVDAKCSDYIMECIEQGDITKAEEAFGSTAAEGVTFGFRVYKAMIKGHSQARNANRVLELFDEMQNKGFKLDTTMLNITIQSWGIEEDKEEMLTLYEKLKSDYGLKPKQQTFYRLLMKCAKAGDLGAVESVFDEFFSSGMKGNTKILNIVLHAYAMRCTKDNGVQYLKECQDVIETMRKRGVNSSTKTYLSLLEICFQGYLVSEAVELLDEMKQKNMKLDIKTFNTVLQICVNVGQLDTALLIFDKIKETSENLPDKYTYGLLLKVCGINKDLEMAKHILEEMFDSEVGGNKVLLNTMLDVYAECCAEANGAQYLEECRELMDRMEQLGVHANVKEYNTLLKVCARGGLVDEAMDILDEMESKGSFLDTRTFNVAIHACSSSGDVQSAMKLFNKMKDQILVPLDEYTFGLLLKVCVNARDLETAKSFFEEMEVVEVKCNGFILGTMLDVYAECCDVNNGREYLKECQELMYKMEDKGVKPDLWAYNTLLKLCACGSLANEAMKLLKEIKVKELSPNVVSYNTILDGLSKDEIISKEKVQILSIKVLEELKNEGITPNFHACHFLQKIAFKIANPKRASRWFTKLQKLKILPDRNMYNIMAKYHEQLGDPSNGSSCLKPCLDFVKQAKQDGSKMDLESYTSLLIGCAKACDKDTALELWSKMIEEGLKPDLIAYQTLLTVYINCKDAFGAIDLFNEMKRLKLKLNSVTYSIMIKCCKELCDPSNAEAYLDLVLNLLKESEDKGIKMGVEGFSSLISACANVSNLKEALKIWNKMLEQNTKPNLFVYTAIIKACLSVEDLDRAFGFLNEMKEAGIQPSDVTYGTFISLFVLTKDIKGATLILQEMQAANIQPDQITTVFLKELNLL